MNPEIKQRWIDALRSKKYQQGRFKLRSNKNTFCCLGVLCDLHRKEYSKRWGVNKDKDYTYYANNGTLPEEVLKWAELELYGETICINKVKLPKLPHIKQSLAILNDSGDSFEEIADVIEKYL